MRKAIIIILLLPFLFNCSEDQLTDSNDQSMDKLVNFNGSVFSESSNEKLSSIVINLKGDSLYSDTTDEEGAFNFLIKCGEYKLSINDSFYLFIDTTIILEDDLLIELYLAPDINDYFPIKLNNFWKYRYSYEIGDNSYCVGVPYKLYEGWKSWIVSDISADSVYEFTEIVNAVELSPIFDTWGCVVRYDTSDYLNSESVFYIKEHDNFQLKAIEGSDLFHSSEVLRYYDKSAQDTLSFNGIIPKPSGDYNIEIAYLKKNTGLLYYNYKFGSSSHHYTFYTLELEDSRIF